MGEEWPSPIDRWQLDGAVIVIGGALTGLLALGVALLLRSWISDGAGPTAAALNEGFSLLYGAEIGLAVGSAVVASAARTGSRLLAGVLAGLLGYVIALAPALVVTKPSDVSWGESAGIATFAAVLVTPAFLLGAAVGAGIAGYRRRREAGPPTNAE